MVYRAVALAVLFAATACQRLPEAEDDDNESMSAGNATSTGGGTFIDSAAGPGSGGAGEGGEDECHPVTQVGCGDGERCTATKSGSSVEYVCVSGSGSLDPFAACTLALSTGDDMCPASYACLGNEASGACVPLCLGDADCDGGVCALDPLNFVPHCANDCSPFEPNCATPLQCRRREDRYACVFGREEDIGIAGDPCIETDDAGCAPGFACIAGELVPGCEMSNCCSQLCDLDGADPCPSPATCASALAGDPAPGFENIGACFVPA